MKAILLSIDTKSATVKLVPGRFRRWLGAQPTTIELAFGAAWVGEWSTVGSRRRLNQLPHWRKIRNAMDFRPIAELPRAAAR